jgi:hypothetical protein
MYKSPAAGRAEQRRTIMLRRTLATLITATALFASLSSFANEGGHQGTHAPCILNEFRITSIAPYREQQHVGRATVSKLKGARVSIQAEKGLTAEWLQLTLGRHLAAMQAEPMKDCAFDVKNMKVTVDSAGAGFSVKLTAEDRDGAKEILRRVEMLR